jgi:mRNA-degrading endonuclease YafQ of YafQ-DinJ toxin-antitoxin module
MKEQEKVFVAQIKSLKEDIDIQEKVFVAQIKSLKEDTDIQEKSFVAQIKSLKEDTDIQEKSFVTYIESIKHDVEILTKYKTEKENEMNNIIPYVINIGNIFNDRTKEHKLNSEVGVIAARDLLKKYCANNQNFLKMFDIDKIDDISIDMHKFPDTVKITGDNFLVLKVKNKDKFIPLEKYGCIYICVLNITSNDTRSPDYNNFNLSIIRCITPNEKYGINGKAISRYSGALLLLINFIPKYTYTDCNTETFGGISLCEYMIENDFSNKVMFSEFISNKMFSMNGPIYYCNNSHIKSTLINGIFDDSYKNIAFSLAYYNISFRNENV